MTIRRPALVVCAAADLPDDVLGHLTAQERQQYDAFAFPKRRDEWLLGRWAAKRAAVKAWGEGASPGAFEVQVSEHGAPCLHHPAGEALPARLSISHSHGLATAVVAAEWVGIDLEVQRPMPSGAWRFFLTEAERDWLAGAPWGPHSELVAWALKEAAYKALQGSSRSLVPLKLTPHARPGWAALAHAGQSLLGRWQWVDQVCLALVVAGEAPAWFADLPLSFDQKPLLRRKI
ncbi:MAG: 4'-phosphopantetheinyl transferase superfamily protein [Candidatus Sericytochromatia bacterium]|nr:4'-phosphopantetheinyl transferase superfamily protein [Candidatus Sericytochromatia bacterium]